MSIPSELESRCHSSCELCNAETELEEYIVPPKLGHKIDEIIAVCTICLDQLNGKSPMDANHWRCLNDSIWNPNPPVQVAAYRILSKLASESWASDLQGMIFLDDETLEWAEALEENALVHKDSNGNTLQHGDTVTLIKDLDVKGAGFTAKRGTAVRRISLVADNAEHIQGKINGQTIIILTKYVKK